MHNFKADKRFEGISPLEKKALLASPTMHEGKELIYVKSAYASGWVTTVGENIDTIERLAAEYIGVRHAVAFLHRNQYTRRPRLWRKLIGETGILL